MKKNIKKLEKLITIVLFVVFITIGSYFASNGENQTEKTISNEIFYEISNIPEYSGEIYVEINNNIPKFTDEDMNLEQDYYSNLENKRVRYGNDKNKLEKG